MSKCGIITLNGYFNYGNRLQNYGLQQILLQYFDEVETIWYTSKEYVPRQFQWNWKMLVKFLLNYRGFRNYCMDEDYIGDTLRCANLKAFTDKYIHTRYTYKVPSKELADEYDFFVVGSDQVWNSLFIDGKTEFLTFAPPDKRVAYAPSIVKTDIKGNTYRNYKKWISDINAISVREESDAVFVEKITGSKPPVLIDPSMLLSGDEWRNLYYDINLAYLPKSYLLVFLIGEKNAVMEKEINEFAQLHNLSIIDINSVENLDIYGASPQLWLYLIDKATLVYTDSFHGVVFSILLETPFVARGRHNLKGMDSRIYTLLKRVGLNMQMLNNDHTIEPLKSTFMDIDFKSVNKIIIKERQRSHCFLKNAFKKGEMV